MARKKILFCQNYEGYVCYWDEKNILIAEYRDLRIIEGHEIFHNEVPKALLSYLGYSFNEWLLPADLKFDLMEYLRRSDESDESAFNSIIKPYILRNTLNENQTNLFDA